ncbi:methyltransferase domain-containing protein [Nocardioides taihuensis]|uniref:Methyltransferase domain-containing protein n=1 Tax=Nocardioides taihuensis TaxID=1835606 RepID=A0ABW0BGZ3_9ACTN
MTLSDADIFDQHLAQWQAWCASPWGRIRFAVVAETLRRQVVVLQEAAGGRPLRVLDVGGGDGRDSRPLAAAGHEVTILDTSAGMLGVARGEAEAACTGDRVRLVEGSLDELTALVGTGFDLVLCHFVLQYRPAGTGDLGLLAGALGEGGRLSVVAPNPAGAVLGSLVRRGPATALEELTRETSQAVTFEHEVRKIDPDVMAADLASVGLDVVARYGARCANDLLADDGPKHDPAYFAELERLELALCDREPFLRTGMVWQLVAQRAAG